LTDENGEGEGGKGEEPGSPMKLERKSTMNDYMSEPD